MFGKPQDREQGFKEGVMRRPSGSSRDESIAGKWSDLRQYEEDQEAALREAHQVLYKSREFLP